MRDRVFISVLLVFLSVSGGAEALVQEEIEALEVLNASYAGLRYVNVRDEFGPDRASFGGSWLKPLEEVCNGPPGWDIHGILCGFGGNIEGLHFTNSWGENTTFPDSLVLPHLKHISLSAIQNLTLYYPDSVNDVPSLGHLTSLEYVSLERASPVTSYSIPDLSLVAASNASLREIHLLWSIDDLSLLQDFPMLEKALFLVKEAANNSILLPPSLQHLEIQNWQNWTMNLMSSTLEHLRVSYSTHLTFEPGSLPTSLRTIYAYAIEGSPWLSAFPPSLESLTVEQSEPGAYSLQPDSFADCTGFKTLILKGTPGIEPPFGVLSSLAATSLERLEMTVITSEQFDSVLCAAPPATLKHLSFASSTMSKLPDCIANYTQLETLNLFYVNSAYLPDFLVNITAPNLLFLHLYDVPFGGHPNWDQVVAQFPRLETVIFSSGDVPASIPFPEAAFMSLTNLTSLSMNNKALSGSLPSDWFTMHPKLRFLDLSENAFGGPIPTAGWSQLVSVDLRYNYFTDFPYIEGSGAPNLEDLDLSSNNLSSIPDDATFSAMHRLKMLKIASNARLDGPMPAFWATEDSSMEFFYANGCHLSGTLPAIISNHFMKNLELHENQLCGPLPEVTRPISLNSLLLASNHLQGSIPASWSSYLSIMEQFDLSRNLLDGTLPNPWQPPYRVKSLYAADLSYNYFSGPMFDLDGQTGLFILGITGENMTLDACATDPRLPMSVSCYLPPLFGCECPPTFWDDCIFHSEECASASAPDSASSVPGELPPFAVPISPPTYDCIIPPPRPGPPPMISPLSNPIEAPGLNFPSSLNCPLPSPGPAFICLQGTWTSQGSVVQPTLTVPGGAVVVVDGNLTIPDTLTFDGLDSQLIVNGCIFLGSNDVVIELTKEDLERLAKEGKITKTLISVLGANDCLGASDLSSTKIVVVKGKGSRKCSKVKAINDGTSKAALQVTFQIDNVNCNLIIILPSVVGAILLLTAVGLVIGIQMRKKKMSTKKIRK